MIRVDMTSIIENMINNSDHIRRPEFSMISKNGAISTPAIIFSFDGRIDYAHNSSRWFSFNFMFTRDRLFAIHDEYRYYNVQSGNDFKMSDFQIVIIDRNTNILASKTDLDTSYYLNRFRDTFGRDRINENSFRITNMKTFHIFALITRDHAVLND